jgi:far upstream element-binding protein
LLSSGGGGGASTAAGSSNGMGMYGPADNGGSSSSSSPSAAAAAANDAAAAERKRKRWGVMPPPETAPSASAAVSDDVASLLSKKVRQDAAAPSNTDVLSVHKRVWVSIDGKPRAHYVRYLAAHFDEIVQKVRAQFDSQHVLELEMQGRGASKEPPVPGMPEQPLHVLVKGTAASAPMASIFVEQALLDAQEADVSEDDYEHERLLEAASSPANGSSAGAIVAVDGDRSLAHYGRGGFGSASSTSTYRPASVAQLIGAHASNLPVILDDQNAIEEEIEVPHSVVGLIIGRGGEAIASLQMRTQCKVQIQKESELRPGQTMRVIHLMASNQEAVDAARSHIERLVQERIGSSGGNNAGGGGGSGSAQGSNTNPKDSAASKVADAIAHGHSHVQVPVPEDDVGLVIGKQGMTIRSIQDSTGANVQVPQPVPGQTHRLVDITHPTMAGAQAAQQQIQDLLNSKPRGGGMSSQGGGGGGGSRGMNGAHTTIQVPVSIQMLVSIDSCLNILKKILSTHVHRYCQRSPTRTSDCASDGRAW